MTNSIINVPDQKVADSLAEIVRRYEDELSADQLLALPYLVYGVSTAKTAELLKIDKGQLTRWMRHNESFRLALGELTSALSRFHYDVLNQLALRAWSVIAENLEDDSPRNQTERLRSARFIIEQLGLKSNKVEVSHSFESEPEVNISEGSVDVIARRLQEIMNGGVQSLEIVDGKYRSVDIEPLVACHPETTFGVMNVNEEGYLQCHICGKWYATFSQHIIRDHEMSVATYRSKYAIDHRVLLEGASAKNSQDDGSTVD